MNLQIPLRSVLVLLAFTASAALAHNDPSLSDPSPSDGPCVEEGTAQTVPYDATCCDTPCAMSCKAKGCRTRCCGRDVCVSSIVEVTEKKKCWNVECEKVCIPKVVAPWAKGGSKLKCLGSLLRGKANCSDSCGCGDAACPDCAEGCCQSPRCGKVRCGKVRCVRVLESESYEVTKSECKWEIRRLPPCGQGACGGNCDGQSVGTDGCGN